MVMVVSRLRKAIPEMFFMGPNFVPGLLCTLKPKRTENLKKRLFKN